MPKRPTAEPIPVAFVTDLLSTGGAESQLIALVNALDAQRIRASVAVLRGEGAQLDRLGVPATLLGKREPRGPWNVVDLLRERAALSAWLREGGFRAVYTTHLWSLLFSAHLKTRIRPRAPQRHLVLLASEHSYRVQAASRQGLVVLRRWALRRADRIVAVAQAQADWLREYYGPRAAEIEVIPNGLDPEAFGDLRGLGREAAGPSLAFEAGRQSLATEADEGSSESGHVRADFGIPGEAPLIVCVARQVAVKALDVLIAAMDTTTLRTGTPHLILVGDGPERPALERQAREADLASRVHFAGTCRDTRPFLAAADLACLASHSEAQPIALLEAMAAGLPVVATRVGGIPEMVIEGQTGLLVPPGDPEAMAGALTRALTDAAWRKQAGRAGRERLASVFSIHERARRVEALVERLVAEACMQA